MFYCRCVKYHLDNGIMESITLKYNFTEGPTISLRINLLLEHLLLFHCAKMLVSVSQLQLFADKYQHNPAPTPSSII